jgi:hypothetical protein
MFLTLQWTQAILGKITKKRYNSNPTTMSQIVSNKGEKFKIKAGSMAIMGMNRATI